MKINSENIEALIVDYFDGALNEQQSKELERAMAQNAEYRQLFNEYRAAMDCTVGEDDTLSAPSDLVEDMKHTSDFDDKEFPFFDRLAVLVTEGIATETEQKEYNDMVLSDDSNLSSAVLYSHCKIQDDNNIRCPYKQTLKHSRIRPLWYALAAAAAVSAIFFAVRVIYAPAYDIDAALISGDIAMNFSGREVQTISEPLQTDEPTIIPQQKTDAPSRNSSNSTTAESDNVEPSLPDELSLPAKHSLPEEPSENQYYISQSDIQLASADIPSVAYPTETMLPVAVDWDALDQSYGDGQGISIDFIGESGLANLKEDREQLRRRWRERQNPKICVSYDDEGKKDAISLLIGNKELRVWSR